MPGDPLREKYIAETYLEDIVYYNQIGGDMDIQEITLYKAAVWEILLWESIHMSFSIIMA